MLLLSPVVCVVHLPAVTSIPFATISVPAVAHILSTARLQLIHRFRFDGHWLPSVPLSGTLKAVTERLPILCDSTRRGAWAVREQLDDLRQLNQVHIHRHCEPMCSCWATPTERWTLRADAASAAPIDLDVACISLLLGLSFLLEHFHFRVGQRPL